MILDYLGTPNTRVLSRGRQEVRVSSGRCDDRAEVGVMYQKTEEVVQAKECRRPPEAEKGEEADSPESLEGTSPTPCH